LSIESEVQIWELCLETHVYFEKLELRLIDISMPSIIQPLAYCCDHGYNELVRTAVEVVMVWFVFL